MSVCAPHRYYFVQSSCLNNEISSFNGKLMKSVSYFKSLKCFQWHTTHHQELKTVLVASGLYAYMVSGRCQG
jgi:hypothetical protein